MRSKVPLFALGLLMLGSGLPASDVAVPGNDGLALAATQKDFLTFEPVLVHVRLEDGSLPAGVGDKLHFEITPAVKPRKGAKTLPIEAKVESSKRKRVYDLLEWYQLPAQGSFTVRAVFQSSSGQLRSAPMSFTIRRPDKKDPEWGPVDRLHHMPWSNYVTDAFCGDTFDVVKRWPDSKLAKYCHYWNGLHLQHKKEYDKAIASFQVVQQKYAECILAEHARQGIQECVAAQKEAAKQ